MEKHECMFCKSTNVEHIELKENISRYYERPEGGKNVDTFGSIEFPVESYFCSDCGAVFRKMDEAAISSYKEYQPFFR